VVSSTGRPLYPQGKSPTTHWIGGWLGPRAGLNAVTKRRNPCRESTPPPPHRPPPPIAPSARFAGGAGLGRRGPALLSAGVLRGRAHLCLAGRLRSRQSGLRIALRGPQSAHLGGYPSARSGGLSRSQRVRTSRLRRQFHRLTQPLMGQVLLPAQNRSAAPPWSRTRALNPAKF